MIVPRKKGQYTVKSLYTIIIYIFLIVMQKGNRGTSPRLSFFRPSWPGLGGHRLFRPTVFLSPLSRTYTNTNIHTTHTHAHTYTGRVQMFLSLKEAPMFAVKQEQGGVHVQSRFSTDTDKISRHEMFCCATIIWKEQNYSKGLY